MVSTIILAPKALKHSKQFISTPRIELRTDVANNETAFPASLMTSIMNLSRVLIYSAAWDTRLFLSSVRDWMLGAA